ncbi:DUF6773 family protein [Companilactobacillus ginsenosidimutans]|uniref:Uncharacterized protein n=1 Tax=Companilactobacillus ginsenosidimutans TaxID=1007676 RepID=A0A0H4QI49_9LACO|nr:DUF6773 family protein [Companilactobacillus ginsenosidimutans]AKP68104.1 hypothetical protein ABM34_11540 [Companilactobacillus ginsenosidimutans]
MAKKIVDERLQKFQGKISKEIINILVPFLILDIIYKSDISHVSFQNYSTELYILGAIPIYMIFRYIASGNSIGHISKISIVISLFSVAGIITIVGGVTNFYNYGRYYQNVGIGYFVATLVIMFISSAILSAIIMAAIFIPINLRQKQINKKLDQEENYNK